MQKSSGFTVVEIIVVCIAVGILASIVIVGWSGTLINSKDQIRETDQKEWVSQFETYRNRYMVYPNSADDAGTTALNGRYCLGANFPSGNCGGGGATATTAGSTALMKALAKVGSAPDHAHVAANGYTGPWADFTNSGYIRIYQSYSNTTCPTGTIKDTGFAGATICYVQLTKN